MSSKYLLYIDILGFSDLVSSRPGRIDSIYRIIDSLNVHSHGAFETIVFSDTVLVYNRDDPISEEEHQYLVWYSIEFAEDLHHRLTGQDIYFRAVLTKGDFRHYKMKNLQAFYGRALIDTYLKEKEIPSLGLFITNECNRYNKYFQTDFFGNELNFVYLNRDIERLCKETNDSFPIPFSDFVYLTDHYPYLAWQVRFLSDIHRSMRTIENPTIRAKFLTAWDFYERRYRHLLVQLVNNDFALNTICADFDFSDQIAELQLFIDEFSRI